MRRLLLIITACAALLITAAPASLAQPESALTLIPLSDGVEVRWQWHGSFAAQRFALYLAPGATARPEIRALDDQALATSPALSELPAMNLAGELRPPLPEFTPDPPPAPLRLVGEGWQRGARIALYELSPWFLKDGEPRLTLRLVARIANASLEPLPLTDSPGLSSVPAPHPLAAREAWIIDVSAEGIQHISADMLRAVGLDLNDIDPARLRLQRHDQVVLIEPIIAGSTVTAIRFYAPSPGDRWSAIDRYWLTVEPTGSAAVMSTRSAQPQAGDVTGNIRVEGAGSLIPPGIYESTLSGFDGDHFFSRQLDAAAGAPVTTTIALSSTLPFAASGSMTVTLELATLEKHSGAHRLRIQADSGWSALIEWSGAGMYRPTLTLPMPAPVLTVTLDPVTVVDRVYLDRVMFNAPAIPAFSNRGAIFIGQAGRYSYPLTGAPADVTVYDVSNPNQPVRLVFSGTAFTDDVATPRRYLVTGTDTLHTPVVTRYQPVDLATPRNARAVYIAPRAFLGELTPLLAHRQSQGWPAVAIAVEDIYAGWSGGEPDPGAIRSFLRYAIATWSPAPAAVILVGDGSSDPRDYLGRGWPTFIPPYLAVVDPWLGETACENCFVQLDGDDPLAETLFLPDLWLGRLPVKSPSELRDLVAKLLAYERNNGAIWQRHAMYLADNPDASGDFAALLDQAIARQPANTDTTRVYYDPAGPPGRIANAVSARQQVIATFQQGAGLLVYAGHGLQFQWAFTDANVSEPFLLNVDDATDLRNAPALPVVLSMTCLTGAFQTPSFRGTTIDEALLLNPAGGAIATWSSSGFGVAYGHRQLLLGFVEALWAAGSRRPLLGELTHAGYRSLALSGAAPETLRAFLLLGDPLTPVTAQPLYRIDLPLLQR
ncbi:C25 family cysteine peptidase [Chloroflexus sp.]|uniref:C25 family cysteine peptidase n=1 Tax=Chloroflexus sp. TaxID=1904827 RepID=UPI002FD8B5DF